MIATRDPSEVRNGHIRAAARRTARIFAAARAAMPQIAWYGVEPPGPVDIPEEPSPPSQGDPIDPGEW